MTTYVAGGKGVAAGRGWDWIAAGWELFKKQAGMWIALTVALLLIMILLGVAKLLGAIVSTVLTPVFAAGLFVAAKAVDEGRPLEFGQLFAGFRERFTTLALVGVIYLGAAVAIALLVGIATGVGILAILGGAIPEVATITAALTLLLAFLVMLALLVPVMMAIWYAPPLVLFHGKSAAEAMKESFTGCLRNIVPFLVYGVVMIGLGIVACIPVMLGWLVLGPVLAASLYTSYKDIYLTA